MPTCSIRTGLRELQAKAPVAATAHLRYTFPCGKSFARDLCPRCAVVMVWMLKARECQIEITDLAEDNNA